MARHYVHISKEALIQMLMNGFEAFVIKHKNNKRHAIEMHASVFGKIEMTNSTYHHYLDFISVDTSAEMTGHYVISKDTTDLKRSIANAAELSILGSMHTHPYLSSEMTLNEVRTTGSHFSPSDLEYFASEFEEDEIDGTYKFYGKLFALHLVLTIRNKDDEKKERQRTDRDGSILQKNIFEISLANCKCFLNVQIFSFDKSNGLIYEDTKLKCDYLNKFKYISMNFGTIGLAAGKKRILEHRP